MIFEITFEEIAENIVCVKFKVRVVIHWLITFAILGVLMYYTYELQQMDHEATSTESGLYTSFSRVGWSVFLCLVIYACVKGYGGPVNWFLSLAMWQPFARLTYAIYLVHMPIMLMVAAGTHRSLYFSGQNIVSLIRIQEYFDRNGNFNSNF